MISPLSINRFGSAAPRKKDPTETQVLRSIYLPEQLDDQLRGNAFKLRISKGDLIRHLISRGLNNKTTMNAIERSTQKQQTLQTPRKG